MAADSSIDETEAAAAAEDKPAVPPEKPNGPPRPPRPVRRTSGSLRIPLPSAVTPGSRLGSLRAEPAARPEPGPSEAPATLQHVAARPSLTEQPGPGITARPQEAAPGDSAAEQGNTAEPDDTAQPEVAEPGAPARTMPSPGMPPRRERTAGPPQLDPQNVPTPLPERPSAPPAAIISAALPGEAPGNIEFSLTRRSSGAPPLSFDSDEIDPSDRAPVAPLTPWRDVPPLQAAAESSNPPPVDATAENDHEDTIVGQVPQNLLELSSEEGEDENTRAYQAPQELIDLARRQREERRQAKARAEQKQGAKKKFADSIPPAARAADELEGDQDDVATATVPLDTFSSDAAPPVARSSAVRGGLIEDRQVSNAPASLEELAAAVSGPGERESIRGVSEVLSQDRTPDSLPDFAGGSSRWWARGRTWAVLVALVLVLGVALARWSGVDLLSR